MTIRSRFSCLIVLACGCTGVHSNPVEPDAHPDAALDIDAPLILTAHHYVMDTQTIPTTTQEARNLGLDLNGDSAVDNQLGMVMGTFASQGFDVQGPDDLAVDRGEILVLVDLGANGFTNSESRVTLYSGANPSPAACNGGTDTVCRHHLQGTGSFTVSPTSARDMPLAGTLAGGLLVTDVNLMGHLQIETTLLTTTPMTLNLIGARMKVTGLTDPGIATGVIAGAVTKTEVNSTLIPAWQQSFGAAMAQDCPGGPPSCGCATGSRGKLVQQLFDTAPRDCSISLTEIANNSLIQALLAPDLTIEGQEALSFGFGFTAKKAVFTP